MLADTARAGQFLIEKLVESPAVGQAGERIAQGGLCKALAGVCLMQQGCNRGCEEAGDLQRVRTKRPGVVKVVQVEQSQHAALIQHRDGQVGLNAPGMGDQVRLP